MEVYNQGDRYSGDRARWDNLNAALMPEKVVFGYSNDDMHYLNSHTFRNYQFMLMEELTEEALREAMLTGATYFCYEPGRSGREDPPVPRISSIEVTDEGTVISITASNADTITWITNKGVAASGSTVDLTALDPDGIKFIRAELKNSSGITHTQPFTLAEYSPGPEDKYTVTFSASENGSLSASVDGSSIDSGALVKAGKNIVFTAVPDPGYRVAAWIVNGETVSGATGLTYTHENLREDIEVIVTFAEPETPPGLVLWLDAADYDAATGQWPDRTGINSVSQETEANRPTKVTGGLNKLPVVEFDGERQYLNLDWGDGIGGSLETDEITIFLVMENGKIEGGTQVVLGNYNSNNEITISVSSQNDSLVARISDYRNSCTFTDEPGPYVLTFDYDAANMRTFVNGLLADTFATKQTINWQGTAIGRSGTGDANYWKGFIAEIRIFDRVLTDSEREEIEEELYGKWIPPKYQVTFQEANALAGASIQVYGDEERTEPVGEPLITNEKGEAELQLYNGTYWFTAVYPRYEEYQGVFTVNGAAQLVNFALQGKTTKLLLHLDARDYDPDTGDWPDKTGINSVTQETEANRPIPVPNGLKGKPVVEFDGKRQYLNLEWGEETVSSSEEITIFLVLQDGGLTSTQVILGNRSSGGLAISKSSRDDNPIVARIYGSSSSSYDNCTFTSEPGPHVLTFTYDGSTMRTYVDGVTANSTASNRSINWQDTAIGRSGREDRYYWKGFIAEIQIYDCALSDRKRASIEEDLLNKYGL